MRALSVFRVLLLLSLSPVNTLVSLDVHPSLVVIGWAKAGTTDFCHRLRHNVGHLFSSSKKELQYLLADNFDDIVYKTKKLNHTSGLFSLDCSPQYVWTSKAAERLRSRAPEANIILLLRHPVDHLQSFCFWRNKTEETVLEELDIISQPRNFRLLQQSLLDRNSKAGLEMYRSLSHQVQSTHQLLKPSAANRGSADFYQSLVLDSLYYPFVRYWVETTFVANKSLILQSESYFKSPEDVLGKRVFPVLFGSAINSTLSKAPLTKVQNVQRYAGKLSNTTLCALQRFYHPYNRMLAELFTNHPSVDTSGFASGTLWEKDYCS
jgi:hypothetical protein